MSQPKKCIVESGHELHYGVHAVRMQGTLDTFFCRCRGCGKTWTETGSRFAPKKDVKDVKGVPGSSSLDQV